MTAVRRTQEERREATRDALLSAAVAVIAERGIEAATLADVSERAGVSKGALTHHYESKEALVDAVLDRVATHLELVITAAWDPTAAPFPRLRKALATLLSVGEDRPPELRVFVALGSMGDHDPRVGPALRRRVEAIERVFADGLSLTLAELHARTKIPPETLSRVILSSVLGSALRPGEAPTDRPDARRLWEGVIVAMIDPFVVDAP